MARAHSETTGGMPELKRPSINPALLVLLVVIIAVVGGGLAMRFVKIEAEREMLSWQNRLSLIADSRASDVETWLERHFKELGNVAANPSLELYLTVLLNNGDAKATAPAEDPAQMVFLRNLLSITADRLGFVDKTSQEIKSINADVRQPSGVGLAIIDNNGKILVSTASLGAFDAALAERIEQAPKGQAALIDMFLAPSGAQQIGFVLPIYPIESASNTPQPIGRLVGVKNVGADLFGLLHHPGATEKTLEAVLLRKEGANVAYLSPQESRSGAPATLAMTTPDLDAAYAVEHPGGFAEMKDSDAHATLMTSRVLAHSPWVMMLHVDRDQALSESETWLRQIGLSLLFALLAMIGFIVAVWYYGTSRRTMLLSLETRRMATQVEARERLLRVVADNQLEPIVIVDQNNVARFANAKAEQVFHLGAGDVAGKDLVALMGHAYAKGCVEANATALRQHTPHIRTWSKESAAGAQVIRSEHIPLDHIPVEGLPVPSQGVLMIDQDITAIVNERERRMRTMRQMIDMLVLMVDRRDPYASNHSACVAMIARAVAMGMGLDQTLVETAETAGNLMNIGKIIVPRELLTKASALTPVEKISIRESLHSSIALLKDIEFDGPVVDTLRQSQERYDGLGFLKMKGDAILVTARIIAAVNAFVGMISPRSYRQALSVEQATKNLLANIDAQFDRRVVVALVDYVENRHGRADILKLISKEMAS